MKIQRSSEPILFFSKDEKQQIEKAVREAELQTSGEIRVHLERKADKDIVQHAEREFERLGMTQTELRNGVLFFIGVKSRRFAVVGDAGIHEKVGADFWQHVIEGMIPHFKADHFADGLVEGIGRVGQRLQEHFPFQREDVNELPDEISYSL